MSDLTPGLHDNIPLADYLALDAIGSTELGWLAVSPLHFKHMRAQRRAQTEAMQLGTAVHCAALEPFEFQKRYVCEPDPDQFGGSKPRATKAYKDAVEMMRGDGRTVIKTETMAMLLEMALSVRANPHVGAILQKAPRREVTALWSLGGGRMARGRIDVLGDGIAADLKTCRSLKDFCPWAIQRLGYDLQAAWYREGLRELNWPIKTFFLMAVESTPPHDVGVWVLDEATLDVGLVRCYDLIDKLAECERTDRWPGMFPEIQHAVLNLDAAAAMAGVED